ncbi:MAG: transcription-repair coupling factor [Bacillota bacterium]|nr:transcription-repair coupling factor [Bacillota bacterium]
MGKFREALINTTEYKSILEYYYKEKLKAVSVTGLSEGAKAHFVSTLISDIRKNVLYVAPTETEAKTAAEDLRFFLGDEAEVVLFPKKDYIFYNVEAMNGDIIYERIGALYATIKTEKPVIAVTSAESAVQYTIPKELFDIIEFKAGDVFDVDELAKKLIIMGYMRSDNVEGVGQFSLRGGILDIFSPCELYPVRIEFFGDEVDTLRSFDPATQISVKRLEKTEVLCCRELVYSKDAVKSIVSKLRKNAGETVSSDIEQFENFHYFSAADKYLPYIYSETTTISDYFDDGIIVLDSLSRINEKIKFAHEAMAETVLSLVDKEQMVTPKKAEFLSDMEGITSGGEFRVAIEGITSRDNLMKANATVNFTVRTMQSYLGKADLIMEDMTFWHNNGYGINVIVGTKMRGEAFAKTLTNNGFYPVLKNAYECARAGEIVISTGSLSRGFEYPLEHIAIVGDKELFGNERAHTRVRKMQGNRIKSYNDLEVGDYVVHHIHGIGKYMGIHRIEVDGITKDYLKLLYRDNDILYIPATSLHLINKYIAGEAGSVKLNRMGGTEFAKIKAKVKKSVEEMAAKLVTLYANRLNAVGHAFATDNDWQKNFEDDFPYEETEDQLRCIEEVKRDMESTKPMDRLLCGDVGFGKTEIALRAAFKAVMDGKQVAYLVPTTILAQQHYNTFRSRMAQYPIAVEMMCRFKTPKQQKDIAKRIKDGTIDIVIGTHRILQKDVSFKNLGLLIVDEEQRFGVRDKEKIKELKTNVDVLTLSATPIPRTLHMAMIGIRDMSVINEPPQNRHPVQTFVMEYDRDVVKEAILKELDRGGQVYYVYNRVEGIERIAAEIQAMAPEARVAVGHGQMGEKQLEEIMMSAMEGEIDILVCTTIIETGLDIPNINTMIIENADCMGLSQLYQLRGRVGRSTRMAYAYLTYRKNKEINETATKRLQSIREFTEFGSGFKIALRDLEIRGAGNMLGPEQHGVMDAVGYDMYCKILGDAITEAKGENVSEEIVTSIDLKADAFIPDKYIESSNTRIEMYKRISSIENQDDLSEILDELIDRFGEPPRSVINLLNISIIGKMASKANVTEITQRRDFINLYVICTEKEDRERIKRLCNEYRQHLMFIEDKKPHIIMRIKEKTDDKMFENIKIVLQRYYELQNTE